MRNLTLCISITAVLCVQSAPGADQTVAGAGNSAAVTLANDSALVQSSYQFLQRQINRIQDWKIRSVTQDALTNGNTCIQSRAGLTDAMKQTIVQAIIDQGLVNMADASSITGGLKAGIFPPVVSDGTSCPTLPMAIYAAPGSAFGGHHSYPGGLMVHEVFNSTSSMNFANGYRRVYGTDTNGVAVVADQSAPNDEPASDVFISEDLIVAAPIWHDWAKPIVFQWNADGTEFTELNFGGNGSTDAWGSAGDSRTGAHHIITIAEMMKRGLPPELVITMASAHSTPTSGNEYKVVNWLRAAAILAQIDPVAEGYLYSDSAKRLRLPQLRQLGVVDLLGGSDSLSHTNTLAEYVIHNLSDSDFILTGPAVTEVQTVLAAVAGQFGFKTTDSNYNTNFRNKVLSYLSAERLLMLYGNGGTAAVVAEVNKFKGKLTN
jgi:hypothetical protein